MFKNLWMNRELTWLLTKREVIGRYRGSFLGLFWSLANPILMLLVYTFVFGVIFRPQWSGVSSKTEFAIVLFAGLIVFNFFSECVTKAPNLIFLNANYVKKVVFPLEILSWVNMGAALFHVFMNLVVLFLFYFVIHFSLNWTSVLLPFVLFPFILITLGLSWFLASFGVYVRDAGYAMQILTMILMFLSPVFYPASAIPESVRFIIYLNPLAFIIEQTRSVLIWGHTPNWIGLGIYLIIGFLTAWFGFIWFKRTRKGFADVI
jgi:lipopolysaccharide transport system permease protein